MCDEQWTEQAELLAIYLAEQFGVVLTADR